MTESNVTIVQDGYVVEANDDRCIGNLWRKSEVLGKEPAPLPLFLMEMVHGPPWD
jgi:hypothetical protein